MVSVVLIDNNDSFTYNIVNVIDRLEGVALTVVNYKDIDVERLASYDRIIISPGPSLPSDYPILFDILNEYKDYKPILGICLGHQTICSYFGASLYNLSEVVHGQLHSVSIIEDSTLFDGVCSPTCVGLYHSWAVDINSLPKEIIPIAVSEKEVLMGVQHSELPIYGIQFHPESFLTVDGVNMLSNFIKMKHV